MMRTEFGDVYAGVSRKLEVQRPAYENPQVIFSLLF